MSKELIRLSNCTMAFDGEVVLEMCIRDKDTVTPNLSPGALDMKLSVSLLLVHGFASYYTPRKGGFCYDHTTSFFFSQGNSP